MSLTFPSVPTSAGRVRYAQAGQGPDVVLIHGALATLEDMVLGPFDALTGRGRVTAFDRPGFGQTPRRRLEGAPGRQGDILLEAMRRMGLQRPVVVGHSFGAAVALAMALEHPGEVAGLVLISPIAFPELRSEHLLFGPRAPPLVGDLIASGPGRAVDALVLPALWDGIFTPQKMPPRYRAEYPFALANGARQLQALGEDAMLAIPHLAMMAARYPGLQVPVEILAGAADIVAMPSRHAARLARLIPQARLKILPGLGHMLHHFAVDEVVEAVGRAFSSSPPGRAGIDPRPDGPSFPPCRC